MCHEPLRERLSRNPWFILDGPTGTELARRGFSTENPVWSAAALLTHPELLHQIHLDYVAAGAELLTSNTFRTHARNLAKIGQQQLSSELTRLAVDLARAAAGRSAWVAGSMAPLEDCYRPESTPPTLELEREHQVMADHLATCGVDVILAETHPTIRESVAAARAAARTGLPFLVSWVCNSTGQLLSGESLTDAVRAVLPLDPVAVMVNCLPADSALAAVRELHQAAGNVPVGVYANTGSADAEGQWIQGRSVRPADYADRAVEWLQSGARLIGGCCGTTPEHIAVLRKLRDTCPEGRER